MDFQDDSHTLRALSGLPLSVDEAALELRFGLGLIAPEPNRRYASELQPVLLAPPAQDDFLSTIYRGIAPEEAVEAIRQRGLIYTVLLLRAGRIGEEWARTRGHLNSPAPGTALRFPETHEIWQGHGLLYLQAESTPEVSEVVVVEMGRGDKALVPPGWASMLVNIGEVPLICGSWRALHGNPQYTELEELGGMAHFIVAVSGDGKYECRPNPHYQSVPKPVTLPCPDLGRFGLRHDEPIFTTFRSNPEFFHFMTRPQDYDHLWTTLYR